MERVFLDAGVLVQAFEDRGSAEADIISVCALTWGALSGTPRQRELAREFLSAAGVPAVLITSRKTLRGFERLLTAGPAPLYSPNAARALANSLQLGSATVFADRSWHRRPDVGGRRGRDRRR